MVGWVARFVYAVSTVQQCNARKDRRRREEGERGAVAVVVVVSRIAMAVVVVTAEETDSGWEVSQLVSSLGQTQHAAIACLDDLRVH